MNRYYFAYTTYDYLPKAELALHSFFYYNDTTLNLFVVDNKYDDACKYYENKPYKDRLNLIDAYSKEFYQHIFSYKYKYEFMSQQTASVTLSTFRIFDLIPTNEFIRVDLDVVYLAPLNFLSKYDVALAGMRENSGIYGSMMCYHTPNHTPKQVINVGIAKYNKNKFTIKNSFADEMFRRLDADWDNYIIPEQDIYNEIASNKAAISELIISPCTPIKEHLNGEIKAIHYNCRMKPWNNNQTSVQDYFSIAATFLLCEVFAKKYNYFPNQIRQTCSKFRQLLSSKNLTTAEQNYINKLIKLRSEVSNW